MSEDCQHVWEEGPLGHEYRGFQKVVHQRCSQCGDERWEPVAKPDKMAPKGDGMICPLRSYVAQYSAAPNEGQDMECVKEFCEWWSADIGHCIVHRLLSNIGLAADLERLEANDKETR